VIGTTSAIFTCVRWRNPQSSSRQVCSGSLATHAERPLLGQSGHRWTCSRRFVRGTDSCTAQDVRRRQARDLPPAIRISRADRRGCGLLRHAWWSSRRVRWGLSR